MNFLERAIQLAVENVARGGGPFGAVITRGDELVAEGFNRVAATLDPTAHAEVVTLRLASQKLKTYDLSGLTIYSSCEPCPMCFAAIYWARLDKIVFAATKDDAARADFRDAHIYEEIAKPQAERSVKHEWVRTPLALRPFEAWAKSPFNPRY